MGNSSARAQSAKKTLLVARSAIFWFSILFSVNASSQQPIDVDNWQKITDDARGQRVYFHAWGGDTELNAHLTWIAQEMLSRFGVELIHVKLADTSSAVTRLIAENAAGNVERGSADLIWINGENFSALKRADLLFGPWAEAQPNFALVDADRYPEMRQDFGVKTEGFESPWTRSQLIFYYDSERLIEPPRTAEALKNWIKENPGEFTYPRPPAFLGTTLLKQLLVELAVNSAQSSAEVESTFSLPVTAAFDTLSAPLWTFLDEIHSALLREGRHFPQSGTQLRAALYDREISLAFAFSPNEVVSSISRNELAASTKSYVFDSGTLSNVSFVAIPKNAPSKQGAMLVSNFLLSPEVQFRAAINAKLASEPVLAFDNFTPEQQAALRVNAQAPGAVTPTELARKIQEPHPSWTNAIEREWLKRYGGGAPSKGDE